MYNILITSTTYRIALYLLRLSAGVGFLMFCMHYLLRKKRYIFRETHPWV